MVHSRVYIFCLLAKVSLWQSKKTFQKKKMRDFYATSSKCQASVFLSQSKSSEYRSVGATMRTTSDNNNDDAKKKKKKKKPLLRRRRRDKRSRFSLFYALFVVVFSSSLFFFFFDESNERMRSFAGEDADATKMISFVSFPVVLVEAAADTAQEAEKRSTSGSTTTINEGTNSIVNFHRHHREVRKRLRERKMMISTKGQQADHRKVDSSSLSSSLLTPAGLRTTFASFEVSSSFSTFSSTPGLFSLFSKFLFPSSFLSDGEEDKDEEESTFRWSSCCPFVVIIFLSRKRFLTSRWCRWKFTIEFVPSLIVVVLLPLLLLFSASCASAASTKTTGNGKKEIIFASSSSP